VGHEIIDSEIVACSFDERAEGLWLGEAKNSTVACVFETFGWVADWCDDLCLVVGLVIFFTMLYLVQVRVMGVSAYSILFRCYINSQTVNKPIIQTSSGRINCCMWTVNTDTFLG